MPPPRRANPKLIEGRALTLEAAAAARHRKRGRAAAAAPPQTTEKKNRQKNTWQKNIENLGGDIDNKKKIHSYLVKKQKNLWLLNETEIAIDYINPFKFETEKKEATPQLNQHHVQGRNHSHLAVLDPGRHPQDQVRPRLSLFSVLL